MTTEVEPRRAPPFERSMDFEYGVLQTMEPGLRRVVCRNPSDFTFKGTNTYVLGHGEVAVVDPGPASDEHLDVLMAALDGERIGHILLTHAHTDHSGGAMALKERSGAVLAGMPRRAGDPALGAKGPTGSDFVTAVPFDIVLGDGDSIDAGSWDVEAIHTPGHAPDHLCFFSSRQNILLAGDHVMGWNTTIVAPPEGNMSSYIRSLERLLPRTERRYYPAHGGPVQDPQRFVRALLVHRRWRESDIADALRQGMTTIAQIVQKIYVGLQPGLSGAAALAVLAQLELMEEKGLVTVRPTGPSQLDLEVSLRSPPLSKPGVRS